ncbi:MAG: alpha-ribazole phosphatase family protein [Betaproteobacteria bacterium]
MQLFLIRHPRPLIDAGICYGQLDVDCEDPQAVAEQLKRSLPAGTPIISSPLQRARKLALALDSQAQIDERLIEINFGEWEGQPWANINRADLDAWAADVLDFTPPGGESVADLQRRAIDFVSTLETPRVALVTHAGILRALLGHYRQLPVSQWTQLKFEFGQMTELKI